MLHDPWGEMNKLNLIEAQNPIDRTSTTEWSKQIPHAVDMIFLKSFFGAAMERHKAKQRKK